MPNRILKESITTSVSLANLTAEAERHFYRLIVQADDYGCFQAHPSIIRANGYALLLDQVSTQQSEEWTLALVKEDIIHLYLDNGKMFGHFVNWEKYQQIRAKRRKWPTPACDSTCNQMISDAYNSPRNPNPNPNPNPIPPIIPLKGDTAVAKKRFVLPEWALGLEPLEGYISRNHTKSLEIIRLTCEQAEVEPLRVVLAFCKYYPIGRLKHGWTDPVKALKGSITVQISKLLQERNDGRPSSTPKSNQVPLSRNDPEFFKREKARWALPA